MRWFSKVLIIPILFTAISANPVEQRAVGDGAVKVTDTVVPLLITKTDSVPQYPLLINHLLPEDAVSLQLWQGLRAVNQADMPLASKGILQNFYSILTAAYQEIKRRQQALLDVINCKNCSNTGNPWFNFLNAVATIPSLQWVMNPNYQNSSNDGVKPGDTFIAATNQNGVVNGVGGSIINGDPIMEYTFSNNQITPVKPVKPVKTPSSPFGNHLRGIPFSQAYWS